MKRIVGLVVAVLLCATATTQAVGAPPASGRSGACTGADNNAVTIVIDYQGLGGGTAVYCAYNLPTSATGLDALRAAGVSYQGTNQDGSGFACRVGGRPSSSEKITLPGGQIYQENCTTTPPGSAYWSYWWASPGGSWSYTTQGALTRRVVFGSYEGWSFSLGGGIGQAPAPRYSPSQWATPRPPSTTSPSTPAPSASSRPPSASTRPPSTGQTSTSPTSPGGSPSTGSSPAGSPSSPQSSAAAPQTTADNGLPMGEDTFDVVTDEATAVESLPASAESTTASPTSSPWPTLVGISVVSFLVLSLIGFMVYRKWTL